VNLQDKSEERLRADLNALEEMSQSRGWAVLIEFIQEEANRAVMAMGKMGMSMDEVAFRRGAIYASQNVINAPSQLLSVMATELLMRKGASLAPATAGALGE
jgi:hypothetical protein